MGLLGLIVGRRHERTGYVLYGHAVAAARDPYLFESLGVPDTLDGRFDAVGLYACLLIRRLRRLNDAAGRAMAQAVFDAMFADMDVNLRELGVGDLSVGKRVRAMWEAFHGRAQRYGAPLDARDPGLLAAALADNVWRGGPAPGAAGLARLAMAQEDHLAGQDKASLVRGDVRFLPAAETVA